MAKTVVTPNKYIETKDGGFVILQRSAEDDFLLTVYDKGGEALHIIDFSKEGLEALMYRAKVTLATKLEDVRTSYNLMKPERLSPIHSPLPAVSNPESKG